MKLRIEPHELDRCLKHLSAYERGCWLSLALHYTAAAGQIRNDDGDLKAITGCSDTNFARVKGQLLSGKPWLWTASKTKIACAEMDEQMAIARAHTQKAREEHENK